MAGHKRNISLDGLRGLAAIAVLLLHCMLSFFPQTRDATNNAAKILYFIYNGHASVFIFFVLSGFVLTRGFFLIGDAKIIYKSAIKRLPRLMGPALVTVLFSYLLFVLQLYRYREVGEIVGSQWLYNFSNSHGQNFQPKLADAILEGAFYTFVRGDRYYDSSLWTMKIEFIGSFVVFSLALLSSIKNNNYIFLMFVFLATSVIINQDYTYMGLIAGITLSKFLPETYSIPSVLKIILVLIAIYFMNFIGKDVRYFEWMYNLVGEKRGYFYIISGMILIAIFYNLDIINRNPSVLKFFSFLGELSFPLYLIHIPIVYSLGCWIFLVFHNEFPNSAPFIAFFVSFISSILAALPLMKFNKWWLKRVNNVADLVTRS